MPDALLEFITELSDVDLLALLKWIRDDPARAIEEFEAVVSRQAPATQPRKGN